MNAPAKVPPLTPADHCRGRRNAPVVIIEYGDFECPNCKQAQTVVNRLMERHGEEICLVFRHFPLEGVHQYALLAAQAVEVAAQADRFWEMHDLLFEHQALLDMTHLRSFAVQLGLDAPTFTAAIESNTTLALVRAQIDGANDCGVRATPTFFVNGVLQDVSFGLTRLHQRVEALVRASA